MLLAIPELVLWIKALLAHHPEALKTKPTAFVSCCSRPSLQISGIAQMEELSSNPVVCIRHPLARRRTVLRSRSLQVIHLDYWCNDDFFNARNTRSSSVAIVVLSPKPPYQYHQRPRNWLLTD